MKHEGGEIEIYIHKNSLSEAYRMVSEIRRDRPDLLVMEIDPGTVVRSAYATLNLIQDAETMIKLGELRLKYRDKPWDDLSSAALALRLSNGERVTVIILDERRHFGDLQEVNSIYISDLRA